MDGFEHREGKCLEVALEPAGIVWEAALLGGASYIEGTFFPPLMKSSFGQFFCYKYTLSFLVTSTPRLFLADVAELYLASMCGNLIYKNNPPFPVVFRPAELMLHLVMTQTLCHDFFFFFFTSANIC